MTEPTIVHLSGTQPISSDDVITFERAFGEFGSEDESSNLFGRGKKRRAARRKKRKLRKAARIAKRKARRQKRHQEKADNEASAQADTDAGKQAVEDAKNISTDAVTPDQSADQSQDQSPQAPDQSAQPDASQSQDSSQDQSSNDSQSQDQSTSTDDGSNQDDAGSGDDGGSDDSGEADDMADSFDGVAGAEDYFSEFSDGKKIHVHPSVADIAKKIEWNKELVSRLRVKKAEQMGKNQDTGKTQNEITDRLLRINELETTLNRYSKFEGDFSGADGSFSDASGRKHSHREAKMRKAEISKARKLARHERASLRKDKRHAKHLSKMHGDAIMRGDAGSETPVDLELNPQIADQRIEIPADGEKSNATGLNGLDLQDDYDAPDVRTFELGDKKSNMTGAEIKEKVKSINWKGIAIGAGIGVAAIILISQLKPKTA